MNISTISAFLARQGYMAVVAARQGGSHIEIIRAQVSGIRAARTVARAMGLPGRAPARSREPDRGIWPVIFCCANVTR